MQISSRSWIASIISAIVLFGCGGGVQETNTSPTSPPPSTNNQWTWVSGGNTTNLAGNYGTKGVPAGSNVPGSRYGSVSWTDNSGNLWLFGGSGYDSVGSRNILNDLWKFDGVNWIWVSGAITASQPGNYGTKGVAAGSNMPGSRWGAVSWIDANGNLWLFGGQNSNWTSMEILNDLWKFDGVNWTWVSGSNIPDQPSNYGTKGISAASNVPGARQHSVSWTDANGIFWLFGGEGYDANSSIGFLNDLWKFDGVNWTWVSGSSVVNQSGIYGTKGVPTASNVPGSRSHSVSWIDLNGNLWLFGGYRSSSGDLNDLWKFDGANWTWVSGSNIANQLGIYGTKGIPASSNIPGSRDSANSWVDVNGNLWLFGGYGFDSGGTHSWLNDLWKFDGANWTWISGSDIANQSGIYGTKGASALANVPGARDIAVTWKDRHGGLWIFGGCAKSNGLLNDLWRYQP